MLRFKLQQLDVPSLGRYLLPLPKLGPFQLALLSAHLEARGFAVRQGGGTGKRTAVKGATRIAIDGTLGVARSSGDMLDALAPAIPALLDSRDRAKGPPDVAAMYFSLKRAAGYAELQVFPRTESLRTWTCLRRDGLCGLTPDEAAALTHVLGKVHAASKVECVSDGPRDASKPLQVGRRIYYKSSLPVPEFLSSLRVLGYETAGPGSYLPRGSVLRLRAKVEGGLPIEEVGEWCCL